MEGGEPFNDEPTEREAQFLSERDSLYMASVGETGWPYVQHRGGPAGFHQGDRSATIGFADFRGNRQYVSVGNLAENDRVALILVDYPNRSRLKLLGPRKSSRRSRPSCSPRCRRPVIAARWNAVC